MEEQLFNTLETNPNLTYAQKNDLIERINRLTSMRINLYQTLSNVNNYFENALQTSQGTLQEQSAAVQIIENELNRSKQTLDMLQTEKANKLRLVEINNYYGERYAEHAGLMKTVIAFLIPIIVLAILYNYSFLPSRIYYGLVTIISIVGAYFFWLRFGSILMRDNMNYDTYSWFFNPSSAPAAPNTSSAGMDPWQSTEGSMGITCIGAECCGPNQTYVASVNQCVNSSTTQESFVNQVYTKTNTTNQYKTILCTPPSTSE
jgi:hypothetical protein